MSLNNPPPVNTPFDVDGGKISWPWLQWMQQLYATVKEMSNTLVAFGDSANLDGFSRLRVSNLESLLTVQCQYAKAAIQMESGNTGTGVNPLWDSNTRMVALSATAGSGTSFMQSFQYVPYQPGKSQLAEVTFVIGTGVAGANVDVGYFDTYNGIFLRQNGASGLQFVRRTSTSGSVVDNTVNQSAWNLDKLDGSGTSGIAIDITKAQILVIDLQFLGMGRVRIGFDINGQIVYCHQFLNANNLTSPYMQSGTLPIQMLLTASSTATTKTSYFKCCAVHSEGGFAESLGYSFSLPDTAVTAGSATRTHLVSLRPKTTYNGVPNRELIIPRTLGIVVTGNNPIYWELCLGQAITSPTWNDVNTTYSAFEYGTGTISGSPLIVVASGYIGATNQTSGQIDRNLTTRYPITLDRSGAVRALGTLSLVVTGIGGTSPTRATIGFTEIR